MRKLKLSDKGKLMLGWMKRIRFHKEQLEKTKKFHREVERGLEKKIRLEKMQLNALKKS